MVTEVNTLFPPTSKSEWQARLEKELKSPTTWQDIQWQVSEYFQLEPYYDGSTSSELAYLTDLHEIISQNRDGRKPEILASADLMQDLPIENWQAAEGYGISGWVASGSTNSTLPHAKRPVSRRFSSSESDPFMDGLQRGHWPSEGDKSAQNPHIHASDIHQAGGSAVQELAVALLAAEEWKNHLGENMEAFDRLTIHLGVGPLFWLELAKIRAMKLLWINFSEANGWKTPMPTLRTETSKVFWSRTDTDTNLIRHTVEAMAAFMGGTDQILVHPHNFNPDKALESVRLSVNISHLLMEESFLHQFADPAGGSFMVDQLTHHLAQAAWKQFGDWQKVGGFRRLTEEGILQQSIEKQANQLSERYQRKEVILLGVNQFQSEMSVQSPPFPQEVWSGAIDFPCLKTLFLDA